MKEIYEAPELNLISYVPAENLASGIKVEFDDMLIGNGSGAEIESGDIGFDF